MILGLIFSKDRALQLDACLASFFRQVTDGATVSLTVVYAFSSPRFGRQYDELAQQYEGSARFRREVDFQADVLGLLGSWAGSGSEVIGSAPSDPPRRTPERSGSQAGVALDCVLFIVDDALFVSRLSLGSAQEALSTRSEALGFSLRLGGNTRRSYVLDREQRVPKFYDVGKGIVKYRWTGADGDFGYPLELSSSMYRLASFTELAAGLTFANPNTLESEISLRARRFARSHPWMLCPRTSVAFSAPLNRVQAVYENRTGADPRWSAERLADQFDQGLRVDVASLDGYVPSACHQEVTLPLRPRTDEHARP